MTSWTLGEIAECLGGPIPQAPDRPIEGVSTDSRTLAGGSLFVPLVGEKFDGHDYARAAVEEKGARAVVWSRPHTPEWLDGVAVFQVSDTLRAYQQLGLHWKRRCGVKCIGITGSVGKTTTKEIVAHLLGPHLSVHKSRANFNNDIGVPKTLLELEPHHDVVVTEMGMRGLGEIARLVEASEPEIGVITAIGTSHIELLGSRENIAKAKSELVHGLPADGTAVLPRSDDFYDFLCTRTSARILSYSADTLKEEVLCPQKVVSAGPEGTSFLVDGKEHHLKLPGKHHLHDLFAALAVGRALGISMENLLSSLPTLANPEGRAEWQSIGKARFFLDAYNSAPESLRASLGVLKGCPGRRIAVLGDMLELGDTGPEAHRLIGSELSDYGVELAFCFGPLSENIAREAQGRGVDARWYESKEKLGEDLGTALTKGDFVLVKASRGMALETIVDAMKEKVG